MDSNTAGVNTHDWVTVDTVICTGNLGIAIKVAGALAALVAVYIIGYVTGYYVHKC
uniref:Uncharacterized protein n=1 Tax=Hucho hucho TaxID=62062 RepID=A0A4W5PF94_9TELE